MPNDMNLNPLFQAFWPSNWNKKGDRGKIESCQKLEDYLAAQGGREPYEVKNYDRATRFFTGLTDLHYLGRTNPSEKTIEVKIQGNPSSFEVLRALVNESAHADQYKLIETMENAYSSHKYDAEYAERLKQKELSDADVIVMKWEHRHPVEMHLGGNNYHLQYTVLDARERGLKFLTQNYTRMGAETDRYRNSQTNEEVQTNFKEYLDTKEAYELRLGKELVNDPSEQETWLNHKKNNRMFTDYDLCPVEQNRICDVFLNDRSSMSDFMVFNKVKNWETEKPACLEKAEKTAEAEKASETKAGKVTLDELEGKQQRKKMKSTHETTTAAPGKAWSCTML